MTNAVPREYIYPDHSNRQQSILTRSTPAYHAPVITAGITHPQISTSRATHAVFTAQQQTETMVSQPWATMGTPGAPTHEPMTIFDDNF